MFFIFLPFFIYTKMTEVDAHVLSSGLFVLVPYYVAGAIVFLIAVTSARLLWRYDPRVLTIRGLASISGVVGYMGLPLILLVLGKDATLPSIILVTADNLVILAGGSFMLAVFERRQGTLLATLKSIAKNPVLLSVGIGLVALLRGWKLPPPIQFFAQQLTVAAGPCALVALGAALATHTKTASDAESRGDVPSLVALKVVVFPLLVYVLGTYVFVLSRIVLQIAVLMAALPVAVNVFILAARADAYVQQSSRVMLFSTLASIVVVSGLLVAMGH